MHSKPQIASFSDDKSVKVWDIPTEKEIHTFNEHNDYVRAGAVNSVLSDVVLSGGYDHCVKMYDTRTEKAVLSVNHGSPIESLLFLPSGGVFISAGGTDIKIWDTVAGGKLIGSVAKHHKTVTCLRLASDNKRLLSGSLDRHVKIYDVGSYNTVFDLEYPNGVLSLGVSKNDDVVAGLVDGLVSVRRMTEETKPEKSEKKISYKYSSHSHVNADETIPEEKTERQTKHDFCLRKFQYSKALDVVLYPYVINKTPEVTVSVIHELMRRKGLHRAFQGRDTKSILQLLRFFNKYVTDVRFTRVLVEAVNIFVDVYGDSIASLPSEVGVLFLSLNKTLEQEVKLIEELGSLMGSMQLLLAGANAGMETRKEASLTLTPSKQAQENLVVNLT